VNEVSVSFGLGTSRDPTPCDVAPDKHLRYVRSISASQTFSTTSTRTRWFPVRPRRLRVMRKRQVLGPATWPGKRAFTAPLLRFGEPHISPLFEACDRARGFIPRADRCGQPLTSVSPPALRFLVDRVSRFRVGPPGRGRQGQIHDSLVTERRSPDRRRLPSIGAISRGQNFRSA